MKAASEDNPYEVQAVGRACELMRSLAGGDALKLQDLAERTGLSRPTAFRLLATLQAHGFVTRDSGGRYQLASMRSSAKVYRIGYASQTSQFAFSRAVTRSIIESAKAAGVELIVLNNDYDPTVALSNADRLLKERIDLMMEFQTDAQIAPLISARVRARKVPLIAIDIPHPGATYFGVNNCQAGLMAGRHLARWAEKNWKGRVDEIFLIGLPQAGSLPEGRLTGTLLGIREVLPNLTEWKVTSLNGNGQFEASFEAVKSALKNNSSRRILVSAINDPSAMGAVEAFRQAGRLEDCAVMGQNGSVEARIEMRRRGTRLVGSVGYFPERYGEQLIALALEILSRRSEPPQAVFIKHQLLTPANLSQFYKRERKEDETA